VSVDHHVTRVFAVSVDDRADVAECAQLARRALTEGRRVLRPRVQICSAQDVAFRGAVTTSRSCYNSNAGKALGRTEVDPPASITDSSIPRRSSGSAYRIGWGLDFHAFLSGFARTGSECASQHRRLVVPVSRSWALNPGPSSRQSRGKPRRRVQPVVRQDGTPTSTLTPRPTFLPREHGPGVRRVALHSLAPRSSWSKRAPEPTPSSTSCVRSLSRATSSLTAATRCSPTRFVAKGGARDGHQLCRRRNFGW